MSSRREFLIQTAGALALGSVGCAGRRLPGVDDQDKATAATSLRTLIIGGTGFVGSYYVQAAVARGHQVTVFSRGERRTALPADVELLSGDRYKDLHLIATRDWDAVIDLAAFAPLGVRRLGQALNDRVSHYTLISSVAGYEPPTANEKLTEQSPLRVYAGGENPYSLTEPGEYWKYYGEFKVLCEREAETQFPGRTLILRPGYIAGPGDHQGQFAYWAARMAHGGDVLVAGDPSTPVQFIDVRDLAAWSIRLAEQRTTGIYNTAGPAVPIDLKQFINAARSAAATSPRLTWVPASWLAAQKDRAMWGKLLYWSFEAEGWAWAMTMSIERALANGLTLRPMSITMADAFNWYQQQPAERQAELLPGRKKKDDSTYVRMTTPWPIYLEREQELLAAWHAQQPKPG